MSIDRNDYADWPCPYRVRSLAYGILVGACTRARVVLVLIAELASFSHLAQLQNSRVGLVFGRFQIASLSSKYLTDPSRTDERRYSESA